MVSYKIVVSQERADQAFDRTVAVTPIKSKGLDFAEVKRICQDCTLAGLKAMYEAGPSKPFRFAYLSAEGVSRDLTRKPLFMGEYRLMRVSTLILLLSWQLAWMLMLSFSSCIGRDGNQGARVCSKSRGCRSLCCSTWHDHIFGNILEGCAGLLVQPHEHTHKGDPECEQRGTFSGNSESGCVWLREGTIDEC